MLEIDRLGVTYRPVSGLMRLVIRTAADQTVDALDDVSFSVGPGEVVGIVGPNGAGKSTLLRAIATLLIPTRGEIRLDGETLDPNQPAHRAKIGLTLPDERSFYWRLSGRQNLEFYAAMVGLDKATARDRVDGLMAEYDLARRDKAVFGYSSGMLARLGLARATLHEPALLILDEPTRSLDPIAAAQFCARVRSLAAEQRAVLLASHRLDDVVQSCDRVLALVDGRVRWTGSPQEIAGDPSGLGRRLQELVDASDGAAVNGDHRREAP